MVPIGQHTCRLPVYRPLPSMLKIINGLEHKVTECRNLTAPPGPPTLQQMVWLITLFGPSPLIPKEINGLGLPVGYRNLMALTGLPILKQMVWDWLWGNKI